MYFNLKIDYILLNLIKMVILLMINDIYIKYIREVEIVDVDVDVNVSIIKIETNKFIVKEFKYWNNTDYCLKIVKINAYALKYVHNQTN